MISIKNYHRIMRFLPNFLWPLKIILNKKVLKFVGKNVKFGPNVVFYNFPEIEIGDNVFIGDGSTLGGNVPIKIGNNVMFGPEVMIRGGDHNFSVVGKPMREVKSGGVNLPITIENDVWIGTRVVILKGVTIGEGAIIGAAAVISKNVLPYSINIGIPSKPIKCRFTREELILHLSVIDSNYTLSQLDSLYKERGVADFIHQ